MSPVREGSLSSSGPRPVDARSKGFLGGTGHPPGAAGRAWLGTPHARFQTSPPLAFPSRGVAATQAQQRTGGKRQQCHEDHSPFRHGRNPFGWTGDRFGRKVHVPVAFVFDSVGAV